MLSSDLRHLPSSVPRLTLLPLLYLLLLLLLLAHGQITKNYGCMKYSHPMVIYCNHSALRSRLRCSERSKCRSLGVRCTSASFATSPSPLPADWYVYVFLCIHERKHFLFSLVCAVLGPLTWAGALPSFLLLHLRVAVQGLVCGVRFSRLPSLLIIAPG